jgi:hypothetical protein
MTSIRSLLILPALAFPCGAFAQAAPGPAQDDPALDTKTVTQQLQALVQNRSQRKNQFLDNARQQVLHAIQSPGAAGNFVIDCYRKVQFEGRSGGANEFSKWKKDNSDVGSSQEVEMASNLHLRYLAITLKRATVDSAGPVLPDVWSYLDVLMKSQDMLGRIGTGGNAPRLNARGFSQVLLGTGVDQGWPAKALGVGQYLGSIPDWSLSPSDFPEILEKDIRTYLREKSDPRLLSTWDYEISYREAIAKSQGQAAFAKFNEEAEPRLLWKKAQDMEAIGMPNRALNLKISIVKQHPEHPDFEQWAAELQKSLHSPGAQPAGSEEN